MNRTVVPPSTIGPILKGVPKPKRYATVVQRMRDMAVGDCFDANFTHKQAPFAFARCAGIRISTRSLPDGNTRVWREPDAARKHATHAVTKRRLAA